MSNGTFFFGQLLNPFFGHTKISKNSYLLLLFFFFLHLFIIKNCVSLQDNSFNSNFLENPVTFSNDKLNNCDSSYRLILIQ
jgi:hypothetical protein